MRVADYLADTIYNHGTKHVFMLSGGGMMHLMDGIACHEKLQHICLHHEQAAAMALEAYARTTGTLGVGYFTTGPGTTNTITGVAGAWTDSVPCLFISGQVKKKDTVHMAHISGLRQIGVQELDIVPLVRSITKYAAFIENAEDVRYHLEKALYFAHEGRPGPVWLDIPLDIQSADIDPSTLKGFTPPEEQHSIPESTLQEIATYLRTAKRPVIMAGHGVRLAGAIDHLIQFVEQYHLPVVTTFLGIDVIENTHPCSVGRIGIKGDRAGNLALQNADCVLILGSSLPIAETGYDASHFAREAKVVVVDIDTSSHKKDSIHIDTLVQADAKEFLEKLSRALTPGETNFDQSWLPTCIAWREKYPVCLPEYRELPDKVNIYYLIDQLSRKLESGDVVVADAGSMIYAGSQATRIKKGMRYILSGGLSSMGYSLPASIGASIGLGNKRVMCLNGDGSFQQNIQELQTLVHHQLPVKVFVFNNDGYLSIRFTQRSYFDGRFIGTDKASGISFPNTEKIAEAYGIHFVRINNNHELDAKLTKTLNHQGPVICEVMTPRDQLIMPTVASEKKPDGTMVSKPLEDMFPFLDRDEFRKNMIIKPLEE